MAGPSKLGNLLFVQLFINSQISVVIIGFLQNFVSVAKSCSKMSRYKLKLAGITVPKQLHKVLLES